MPDNRYYKQAIENFQYKQTMKDQTLISKAMALLAKKRHEKYKDHPDYKAYYRALVRQRKRHPVKKAINDALPVVVLLALWLLSGFEF